MSPLEKVGLAIFGVLAIFFCEVFLVPVQTTNVDGEPCQRTLLRMFLVDLPIVLWRARRLRNRAKR